MPTDQFYEDLERLLKQAEDEDDVLGDLDTAKNEATKNEELPDLGMGEDVLDPDTEKAFEPALSPSNWEVKKSGDGYVVFVKKDSKSDPDASKGRYEKRMQMETGEADDAIIDYINAFLVQNKVDTNSAKHMTMRTKYGPRTIDEYGNDIKVIKDWQSGKYTISIRWRQGDKSVKIPAQFKKEIEIPDELAEQPETPEPAPGAEEEAGIPSLEDVESMTEEGEGPEEGEEVGEENPEEEETPEEEEESPEEGKEEASLTKRQLVRLSRELKLKAIFSVLNKFAKDPEGLDDLALDEEDSPETDQDDSEEIQEDDPESKDDLEEDTDDTDTGEGEEVKENEIPASADVTEVVNNILDKTNENGKSVFQAYIEDEALPTGVLFTRDFKDIKKYRDGGDTDKLRDKEMAMADRIYSDIDRILKTEAPSSEIKTKIGEMSKNDLEGIIADNLETLSAGDTAGKLMSDVQPEDISEAPKEGEEIPEEEPQEEKSNVEKVVEKFYEMRGTLTSVQRRDVSDMELLEKAGEKINEEDPDNQISDDDLDKAKRLISVDLEGRGDLIGNP